MTPRTWLYKIQPSRADMLSSGLTPEEERLVGEHFEYLKRLSEEGFVLLAGRTLNTDDTAFGIVIFKANDEDAARRIFEGDPAVKAGVFKGEVYPYSVAIGIFAP